MKTVTVQTYAGDKQMSRDDYIGFWVDKHNVLMLLSNDAAQFVIDSNNKIQTFAGDAWDDLYKTQNG